MLVSKRFPLKLPNNLNLNIEVHKAANHWLEWLTLERRAATHTIDSYARDVSKFLAFMSHYKGNPVGIDELAALKPVEFRAFLAQRRMEGLGNASLARALSALKSLYRFLDLHQKIVLWL